MNSQVTSIAPAVAGVAELRTDFLVIAALLLERDAVLARIDNGHSRLVAGYPIHEGTIAKSTVAIALADKMGNVNSATVTTALILALRPQNVLLVGIAAGIRKQSASQDALAARRLGDVLLAEQVVAYEPAKIGATATERRPDYYRASASLMRTARELHADEWSTLIRVPRPPDESPARHPIAYAGTVLSGEKVVANAHFLSEVRQVYPTAIGLEMEGVGVAIACHQANPAVGFLLIKAICDFADVHKADDWQPYAADVAAVFAMSLIERMASVPISINESVLQVAPQPVPAAAATSPDLPRPRATRGSAAANDESQRSARTRDEQLAPDACLEAILGSPFSPDTGSLKQVTAPRTADPPPLPTPHISRSTTLSSLARELPPRGIVAVIGYAKSGKTSLLTEFAMGYPGACAWLNVERLTSFGEEWWELALFQLAGHFGLAESTPAAVRDRLLDEAKRQPVLIVIDDAQLLPDLNGMGFLEQAVAASNGRVVLLLAGVDEPAFVERIRSRGIMTWRVPGFALEECQALFQNSIGDLSSSQQAALAVLRDRTDGHPGFVWLCRDSIRQIETIEDGRAFVASFDGGLGTGPDAFHAALFRTFQSGLATHELELCRRLAIALHGFSRRLAESLWHSVEWRLGSPTRGTVVSCGHLTRSGRHASNCRRFIAPGCCSVPRQQNKKSGTKLQLRCSVIRSILESMLSTLLMQWNIHYWPTTFNRLSTWQVGFC